MRVEGMHVLAAIKRHEDIIKAHGIKPARRGGKGGPVTRTNYLDYEIAVSTVKTWHGNGWRVLVKRRGRGRGGI
jgi:hypothetical protein